LRALNLAHNRISTLYGLTELSGKNAVVFLDVRDNEINDPKELGFLAALPVLCSVPSKLLWD